MCKNFIFQAQHLRTLAEQATKRAKQSDLDFRVQQAIVQRTEKRKKKPAKKAVDSDDDMQQDEGMSCSTCKKVLDPDSPNGTFVPRFASCYCSTTARDALEKIWQL